MSAYLPSVLLLSFCWIASLAILLIFLESWFTERNKFVARRASGPYGICSVFVVMRGPAEKVESTIRSVFTQSYPFIELFLIYSEDDPVHAALAQEFRQAKTHVAVRLSPVSHAVEGFHDRVRALEVVQPSARGRWYVAIEAGLLLDQFAVEASMEFAGTGSELIDIDMAIESCGIFVVLVDHDIFKSVPLDERIDKAVYDTRGIWPDQPHHVAKLPDLRAAG